MITPQQSIFPFRSSNIGAIRRTLRLVRDETSLARIKDIPTLIAVFGGWAICGFFTLVAAYLWADAGRVSADAIATHSTAVDIPVQTSPLQDPAYKTIVSTLHTRFPELDIHIDPRGLSIAAKDNQQYFVWLEALDALPRLRTDVRFSPIDICVGDECKHPPTAIVTGTAYLVSP